MKVRFGLGSIILGMMAFLIAAIAPSPAEAQQGQTVQGRFKVLIPAFTPLDGAKDKPGKQMAEELAELINELPTHQPVEKKEFKDALKRFDLDEDDLNCISAVQLANQINAAVVVCGEYSPSGDGFEVRSTFRTPGADETFDVDPFTVPEKDAHKTASQQIATAFETLAQQQRYARFCAEYAQSQQWDNAMTNCNSAIEINPEGTGSLYTRGAVYMNQEMFAEALTDFEKVLEINPMHENAMQGAGYTSAKMGDEEAARSYYNRYLELNPSNATVRMNVAFELAKAGDPYGAMQMIEEGLELDAENVDLYEQLGGYAFAAAAANGTEEELSPETGALYRRAIEAYSKVFEAKAGEANVAQIRNVIAAHVRLGELDQAISLAERSIGTHPEEPSLVSTYADALEKSGRRPEAIEQIRKVIAMDPGYRNGKARLGKWLLDEGNTEEAIPVLRDAVNSGDETGDRIANLLFADGYQNGIQTKQFNHADKMFQHAEDFAESEKMKLQVGFWQGFAAYRLGEALQDPQNLANAERSLPYFQRARTLFQQNMGYSQYQEIDIGRLIEASGTYIEIQEAIIKRGG